jgi:hypothetical protein
MTSLAAALALPPGAIPKVIDGHAGPGEQEIDDLSATTSRRRIVKAMAAAQPDLLSFR